MNRQQLLTWLRERDDTRLRDLWSQADAVRRQHVGDAVHLRGLVEFSNYCVQQCHYCGLRLDNRDVERYRMPADEVLACAQEAVRLGYGTIVMQSGEDRGITKDWLADVVRRIKAETPLAVTLSVGEREPEELQTWRAAGADRYLLRFETSNPDLYRRIHPDRPGHVSDRIALLRQLRDFGYEVGSGVMIGIPGQTYDDLAGDITLFAELDLDMIGVGPYLAHPDTPLAGVPRAAEHDQVPNDELMTYKTVALTRLMCPDANIPSTTALATINKAEGRELGLQRGANIVMPNLTPVSYRAKYEIYPAKACIQETAQQCYGCLTGRITRLGRSVGTGRGDSPNRLQRDLEQAPAQKEAHP
jgi:biotin synthase